jgi:hypothetical protein
MVLASLVLCVALGSLGLSVSSFVRARAREAQARENIVLLEARTCERFLRERASCVAAGDLHGAVRASRGAASCALDAFRVAASRRSAA